MFKIKNTFLGQRLIKIKYFRYKYKFNLNKQYDIIDIVLYKKTNDNYIHIK